MKARRIFVSGGAGVIGAALVRKLIERGALVWVGDLKPRPEGLSDCLYRQGDLNELRQEEIDGFEPDVFIHLAATFERSLETPDFWSENFRHNVLLSNHLCSILRSCKSLRRIVFASSYLVYDPRLYIFSSPRLSARSLSEDDAVLPRNLCGAAKFYHELELRFLSQFLDHCEIVNARIFRGYGKNSRDVISRWIRDLLRGRTLEVFRPEGIFDFTYSEDTAEALLRLADSEASGNVNIGSGIGRSIADVLGVLRSHFPRMDIQEVRSDLAYEASQADVSRLRSITGWHPRYAIESAIPEIIEHESHRDLDHDVEKMHAGPARYRSAGVLVTSISRKVPLIAAVRSAAKRIDPNLEVVGADMDAMCVARHFVDEFLHVPAMRDFPLSSFLSMCKENHIKFLIPTRDAELTLLAEASGDFATQGIAAMVSERSAVLSCRDKLSFAETLTRGGFPVVPTALSLGDIDAARFVVKERRGSGSTGVRLNVSRAEATACSGQLSNPVFQPFLQGIEYSVDLYVDRLRRCKGTVARIRDVVIGGESQITTTVRHKALEDICARAAEFLGLYGHGIFQVIEGSEGFHIIECNPRFGGASSLSIASGLDSFYWFMLESEGTSLERVPFRRAPGEKRQIRYPADLVVPAEDQASPSKTGEQNIGANY
jgi:carbamoyl-phosphate synthase large subunit